MLPHYFGSFWPLAAIALVIGMAYALKKYPVSTIALIFLFVIIIKRVHPDWMQKPPCGAKNFHYKP